MAPYLTQRAALWQITTARRYGFVAHVRRGISDVGSGIAFYSDGNPRRRARCHYALALVPVLAVRNRG